MLTIQEMQWKGRGIYYSCRIKLTIVGIKPDLHYRSTLKPKVKLDSESTASCRESKHLNPSEEIQRGIAEVGEEASLLSELVAENTSSKSLNFICQSEVESSEDKKKPEESIENHFIDVGTISAGAIFGLGEDMVHRAIMAKNTVQCVVIPRYWLLEKRQNTGNIWQKTRFYLNATIPSREALFKDFLNQLKWQAYKNDLLESLCGEKAKYHPTRIEDVPKISRIIEGI